MKITTTKQENLELNKLVISILEITKNEKELSYRLNSDLNSNKYKEFLNKETTEIEFDTSSIIKEYTPYIIKAIQFVLFYKKIIKTALSPFSKLWNGYKTKESQIEECVQDLIRVKQLAMPTREEFLNTGDRSLLIQIDMDNRTIKHYEDELVRLTSM